MKPIGTIVIAYDGFGHTYGQVAGHERSRDGKTTSHVIACDDGETQWADRIDDENYKGIGWKVANAGELRRRDPIRG